LKIGSSSDSISHTDSVGEEVMIDDILLNPFDDLGKEVSNIAYEK
jgi:hypothetical protein